jgi:hypothetical protein
VTDTCACPLGSSPERHAAAADAAAASAALAADLSKAVPCGAVEGAGTALVIADDVGDGEGSGVADIDVVGALAPARSVVVVGAAAMGGAGRGAGGETGFGGGGVRGCDVEAAGGAGAGSVALDAIGAALATGSGGISGRAGLARALGAAVAVVDWPTSAGWLWVRLGRAMSQPTAMAATTAAAQPQLRADVSRRGCSAMKEEEWVGRLARAGSAGSESRSVSEGVSCCSIGWKVGGGMVIGGLADVAPTNKPPLRFTTSGSRWLSEGAGMRDAGCVDTISLRSIIFESGGKESGTRRGSVGPVRPGSLPSAVKISRLVANES